MAKKKQQDESTRVEKSDRSKPPIILFVSEKAARPKTVFGFVQEMIAGMGGIQTGNGVELESAIERMMETFEPRASKRFDRAYCRAYLLGGVKEGYLVDDPANAAAELPVYVPKSGSKEKSKGGLSKAGGEMLDILSTYFTQEEYESRADKVTAPGLADALGRKPVAISKVLSALEKRGYVELEEKVLESEDGSESSQVKFIYLTEKGWVTADPQRAAA